MAVKIVTDSTADLPPELAKELDITIVPVYVSLRGQSYREGVDISLDEIYQNMAENDAPVTTSQPSPADFAETYRQLMQETDEILVINIASPLSGAYGSAVKGQELAGGKGCIEVVDSASTSMGLGLLAIAAARLAQAGASLPHILAETKRSINRTHIWAMMDTLKYALRSGRLGRGKAMLGSLLSVKPMITLKNGEVHPAGMMRTRQKGLDKFIANVKSFANVEEVGIVHSTTPDDAQTLKSRLSSMLDIKHIHLSRLGPALGLHTGPGTIALALREKLPAMESAIINKGKKLIEMPALRFPHLSIQAI